MTDDELASACVAVIDNFDGLPKGVSAELFIRDWRVAGAMLEYMPHGISLGIDAQCVAWCHMETPPREGGYIHDKSLPRAIIEACLEALND